MRRDYKSAIKAAVNGLYHGSEAEMESALREILEALDSNMAELMHENESAAFAKVNDGEDLEDEPLEFEDSEGY